MPNATKHFRLLCAAAVMALAATPAAAQSAAAFPNKPVRLIIPLPPGGSAWMLGTIYSDKLGKDLGQSLVMDSRPGGGSVIGTLAAVRAAPDGHTLLLMGNTLAVNHWTQSNLPYDTLKDLAGISTIAADRDVLAIHASVPAANLKELVAYARQNPGKLNARIAPGAITHLSVLMFMEATGTRFTMVPYKGTGAAVADMLAGTLHMAMTSAGNVIPHIRAGKLKGIAVAGERRSALLPDVPTFAEAGLKELRAGDNWNMLLAPAATPRDIIDKLNAIVTRAQAAREVQDALTKAGFEPMPNSVAATNALLRNDVEAFGKVVKEHNVKAEDA